MLFYRQCYPQGSNGFLESGRRIRRSRYNDIGPGGNHLGSRFRSSPSTAMRELPPLPGASSLRRPPCPQRSINFWPPKPGLTDIMRIRSSSERTCSSTQGVAGFRQPRFEAVSLNGLRVSASAGLPHMNSHHLRTGSSQGST